MSNSFASVFDIDDSALFTLEPETHSGNTAVADDRRFAERITREVPVRLVASGRGSGSRCILTDISEGGARVQLPASAGLTVGQRLEISLADESDAPDLVEHLSSGCYATIVRTERCDSQTPAMFEAGLRFDQPLML